jgi:hypothetical protein
MSARVHPGRTDPLPVPPRWVWPHFVWGAFSLAASLASPGSESEWPAHRREVRSRHSARRDQHLSHTEPLAQRAQRRLAPSQCRHECHGCQKRRTHPCEPTSQPAQPGRQRDRVRRRCWSQLLQRRLLAHDALRCLDHRLYFRQSPRQPRGQKIRQKTDRYPGCRAQKPCYPHPYRPHPTVAAVPAKSASTFRVQRALLQSCGPPQLLGKVPLAGNGRWVTYNHSVAGRVRAGSSAAGQPSPAISFPQISLSGKKTG